MTLTTGDVAVVEASSSNGDVAADGVTGDGTYETTNGDVTLLGL